MPSGLGRIDCDIELPVEADVVIIGGGIIGVCTAYFLTVRGLSVVLVEKGEIGGEQSSRNWGWCRTMGRHPHEIPISLESMRIWENWQRTLIPGTGFRRTGVLYVVDGEEQMAPHRKWMEHAREYQLDTRLLDADEVARLLPGSVRRFAGGIYTASDGQAEPLLATPAIARAGQQAGLRVIGDCAVRSLDIAGGKVEGVVTERGRIRASAVVLCGGAWSRLFCGNHGVDFPQLKVLASAMRTSPVEGGPPDIIVGGSDFTFRKRLDGGYTIARRGRNIADIVPDTLRLSRRFLPALKTQWPNLKLRLGPQFIQDARMARRWSPEEITPFERTRTLDPAPTGWILDEGWTNLRRAFPAFEKATIEEKWAGLIDTTPDATPVISAVPTIPGFFLSSGYSGHGFGLGPGAGSLMADLVTGNTPVVDPTPYRFERFGGGTAVRH